MGVANLQAGAGVVADSDPDDEHCECQNKAIGLVWAIDLAECAPEQRFKASSNHVYKQIDTSRTKPFHFLILWDLHFEKRKHKDKNR